MHDLVIRDGLVVDGSGRPPFPGDVAVDGDRIVSVGPRARGRRELRADGRLVLPGWVDVHTHYDAQVTWDPLVSPSSSHGVTTLVMGNCGVGFAPVREAERDWLVGLMEGVEDIPGAAMTEGIDWRWTTFPEYLDALSTLHRAVDFAAQVPHGAVRAFVMGERGAANEPATPDDVVRMAELVRDGIAAGAVGFSTSRTPIHKGRDGRLVPGTTADEDELLGIAAAMGGGVFQLTADHVAVPDELGWIRRLARATGRTVSVNLVQTDAAPDLWRDVLAELEAADEPVWAQVAARPAGILMTWRGSAHPFLPVPAYLEVHFLPWEERLRALRDPERRRRITTEAPLSIGAFEDAIVRAHHKMFRLGDPPDYEPPPERSAAASANPREVVYDWLMEGDGTGVVYFPLFNYARGHTDHLAELLSSERTFVGLGDGGAHCGAICDASVPTWLLCHWARDRARGTLPLERLVHQQTRRTALAYGLADRGLLAPGLRADVNVVDADAVGLEPPRLVWDLPAGGRRFVQGARGYAATVLRGAVTFEDGVSTGVLPGRLVRGGHAA